MKKLGSAADPLWYKDAIIYELHVRAFADSNNDGIGDFPGLMSQTRLPPGARRHLPLAPALLPLAPARRRLRHLQLCRRQPILRLHQRLQAVPRRRPQTQHAGDDRARHQSHQRPAPVVQSRAPCTLPARPSATCTSGPKPIRLYQGVRIIFTDTEKSNWTWDDTAKAFYWHRFFSHQPDLNFDNPRVMQEVLTAMRFWLDMGVDALRLDAIPYLIERDGTSCENVPETHVKIKEIRKCHRRGVRQSHSSWPKPTCGPPTCALTLATATNATWPSTSR